MHCAAMPVRPFDKETRVKLYHHPLSGHAHRVRLFPGLLGITPEPVAVDLAAGAHRQPAFLARGVRQDAGRPRHLMGTPRGAAT